MSDHDALRSTAPQRLTRADVGRLLVVSTASVRRMEGKELHPTIVDGVHVFDPAEVARVAQERSRHAVNPTREGERDARCFALLDEGHDVRDLVRTLRISACVANDVNSAWTKASQRDVVVPPACRLRIEQCLGPFRDGAELAQRVHEADTENDRLNDELTKARNSLDTVVAQIGWLAARNPALAQVLPELRQSLAGELPELLDQAFDAATAQVVSTTNAASAVAEPLKDAPTITADAESSTCAVATAASAHDEKADSPVTGEPGATLTEGAQAAEAPALTDGGDVNGASDAASAMCVERSPREQLLDTWLASLTADEKRLERLGALLTREELQVFAGLERGIGTDVATIIGTRSRREQLLDTLLVSLAEDDARLDRIGAMLTPSELDMLARLGRGLAECEPGEATTDTETAATRTGS